LPRARRIAQRRNDEFARADILEDNLIAFEIGDDGAVIEFDIGWLGGVNWKFTSDVPEIGPLRCRLVVDSRVWLKIHHSVALGEDDGQPIGPPNADSTRTPHSPSSLRAESPTPAASLGIFRLFCIDVPSS